jgi:hypothetical protein
MPSIPPDTTEPPVQRPSPVPLPAWALSLPDDEMIGWVWTLWLAAQTEAKGIPLSSCSPQLIEIIRLETLRASAEHAPNAAFLQVMKDFATGHRARAAKMFRELMVQGAFDLAMFDQFMTSRLRQSERARKPRERELNAVIRPWVERQPDISSEEVLRKLRFIAEDGDEVIRDVTDVVIRVASRNGGNDKEIKVTSLPSRLSRIKKQIRKSC